MRFMINLLRDEDRSVVTADGEYLGTWGTDETDAIYQFTPDGASEPIFGDPFMGPLCKMIEAWHSEAEASDLPVDLGIDEALFISPDRHRSPR